MSDCKYNACALLLEVMGNNQDERYYRNKKLYMYLYFILK